MNLRTIMLLCGIVSASSAIARGVSPYLPLNLSPEIERQIERVLLYADQPLLTRPIAAAAVFDALPAACERDAMLCAQVRLYLNGYMKSAGLSHASLEIAADSGTPTVLPNRRGQLSSSEYEVSASGYWQPGDNLLVTAGLVAYETESVPTGSMVSIGFDKMQIDIGYRDHWFSPMASSSMLISTQAQNIPSITVSNYKPLSRWNLRYEVFLGELSESNRILYRDGFTSGNPRLAGMHLSLEPLPGWSIGVNRIMQFGGGARGGNSLRDVFDAFFDPSGRDNTGSGGNRDAEFGNQVAAITSRIMIPGPRPFSVYFEYAGEDTSTNSNARLGNAALSAGLHFPHLWRNTELTFEMSEWQNGWYVNGIYQDGLQNDGNIIGHWGGDWRVDGDGIGGRSLLARIGLQPGFGGWLEATWQSLDNEDYSAPDYQRANRLEVLYSRQWREYRLGINLTAGDDSFGRSFSRLGTFIRF